LKPRIITKRAYEDASPKDGFRVLVDRLWPRGVDKKHAAIDEWAKDLAPSSALRKWFGHDPERWVEFQKQYRAELRKNESVDVFIENHQDEKLITLVYAAKDTEHNQALVLQDFLQKKYES